MNNKTKIILIIGVLLVLVGCETPELTSSPKPPEAFKLAFKVWYWMWDNWIITVPVTGVIMVIMYVVQNRR